MSEINSQINIQMIESIKEQSGTKTSLEKLNLILQEMHKDMMKENNSNLIIKTSNNDEKNKTEEENQNQNEDSNFIEEIKGDNDEIDEQDKERTTIEIDSNKKIAIFFKIFCVKSLNNLDFNSFNESYLNSFKFLSLYCI